MKQAFWAAILTVLLLVLSVAADNTFGADNAAWKVIENTLNFPGTLILKMVGPGHDFSQLALPFFVSVAFYFLAFWGLLIMIQKCERQHGPRSIPR